MQVERVVLGATYCGCGIALAHPKDTLIIERGSLIGTDFADSLNERGSDGFCPETKQGKEFFSQLEKRGLVNQKDIYLGASVYVLSDMLKKADVQICFNTQVIDISKENESFVITVYGAKGFETIVSNSLIDTTATGVLPNRADTNGISKYLCAIVTDDSNLPYYQNSVNKLCTYFQSVELDCDWGQARQLLCDSVKAQGGHIIHIANSFAYSMDNRCEQLSDMSLHLPSQGFENALVALDGGAEYETL